MTACIAMENDELVITIDNVGDDERGRCANVEIQLLRELSSFSTASHLLDQRRVEIRRDKSTMRDYEIAKGVLRGFCLLGDGLGFAY